MTKPILESGIKGVVTTNDWIMCPDGDTTKYVFGALEIFSEGDLLGFVPKQDAGWYIVVNRKVLIPGCQVRGVYLCDVKPASRQAIEP